MELPAQTLHDFVLDLLTNQQALSAFQADPQSALAGAGLSDISASEVHEIVPLVMDYVPMSDAGGIGAALSSFQQASPLGGQAAAVDQLQRLAHAFSMSGTGDGFTAVADYTDPASGLHGAGSVAASVTDGIAGGETVASPLGGELFSGAVSPDGAFEFGSSYAANPLGVQGWSHVAGSPEDGVAAGAGLTSPYGGGAVSGSFHPNGDFRTDAQLSSDTLDSQAWSTIRGNLSDGVAAGGGASTPLGEGAATGSFTTDGHVQQNVHLASDALGTSADTGLTGDLSEGLAGSGAVNSPLGDGEFSLSVPGLDDLSVQSLDQSFSDGSNTVASALANPAAGNPADAVGALFGNAPVPELHFTPAENPLGNVAHPDLGDSLPQSPVTPEPSQDPAGGAAATAGDAADAATSQATPDTATTQAQQGAGDVAGQLTHTVHHTLGTVTDGLQSATSGLTDGSASDPAQSVQSTVDSVTGDVPQSTASQSPLGDSDAGSSSGAAQLTDSLEHNAVADALHDVGDSLDLHL